MRTWQSQELKKKIYKNDDNPGIFKEKLFKLISLATKNEVPTLLKLSIEWKQCCGQ